MSSSLVILTPCHASYSICWVYICLEIYCMLTNTMHHNGREQCGCDTHMELPKLFTCSGASPGVGKHSMPCSHGNTPADGRGLLG